MLAEQLVGEARERRAQRMDTRERGCRQCVRRGCSSPPRVAIALLVP